MELTNSRRHLLIRIYGALKYATSHILSKESRNLLGVVDFRFTNASLNSSYMVDIPENVHHSQKIKYSDKDKLSVILLH